MEFQKVNKSAGRISPTPMGDYDDTTTYRRLDWVYYGGTSYICKKNNTLGIKPSNPERWQKIIDEIGDMEVVFTESEQLENIVNGDKLSIIFGKIKKWFTHLNDIICRDNNDTKVTRIRADEGVQVSNRANDRHIPVYASDFVAGAGGTIGRSLANLSLKDLSDNNHIDVLTNINQITSIGFWKIGSIDSSYAQSIGITPNNNTGDFYAIVSNYNGDGSHFYYGNLQLYSPRLGTNFFTIQVWNEVARAECMIIHSNVLNTIEQISACTESPYTAGALAAKAIMADYNAKINQINSNMNKLMVANFGNVLDAYGIDKSTIFNNMTELNAALPINIHTICTINTDTTARQIANAVPNRYGTLEIIKGYNDNFCTFILYGSAVGETYIYTSRYRSTGESLHKWRRVMWEYVN